MTGVKPVLKNNHAGFLLLSLVLAIIFLIVVLMPLEPSDYWTYLRIGQEIQRTGNIPTTEFMTYTSGGQPAIYSYWLSSLLLLGLSRAGGFCLTALVMGGCVVLFYVFIWLCLRELKIGPMASSLLLLVAALMGSNNWSTRPQNFALPLFGLCLLILLKWQHKKDRLLWLIPLLGVMWTNLHGSFILLFILLISALIFGEGSRSKLLWVTLVTLAVTLVNPYGFRLWTHTLGMIGNDLISTYSFEWQPPTNQGWQMNLFFGSLLGIAFVTAYSQVKAQKLWWVWFLGFGWMALSSTRYVLWFSVIVVLLLAQLATPFLQRFLDRKTVFTNGTFNIVIGIAVLTASLAFLPGIRQRWWSAAPQNVTDTTPVAAVEWLKGRNDLSDNLWGNWVASIYMSYALPERKVWITNRIEDFNEQIFLDNQSLMRASYNWEGILERYGVNLLLLDRNYNQPLIQVVSESADWQQVYEDDLNLIFAR